ncbi:kinase-like protein [Cercophora scortea]|uniref:non-specific serine/threonine protein kinase n=1 Tax=Cercophora scortea TaxID=314031 RepID=A0AAE0J1R2_9PEZI|nr:kinase-like protein [Cercophora scortea]
MSNALLRSPAEPTVIHRTTTRGRPPLQHTFEAVGTREIHKDRERSFNFKSSNTESSKNSNSNSNSNSGKTPNDSTGLTSLESKSKASSSGNVHKNTNTGSSERKHLNVLNGNSSNANRRNPNARSSPDSNLTTIQETVLDQASPSVLTVERAAAAKVFLETYYDELLAPGPSPRSMRLRLRIADFYCNYGELDGMSTAELNAQFHRRESNHLREIRVMKSRSIRALSAPRGSPEACLVNDYEVVKILGKGSFGVVRLVREKPRRADEHEGNGWSDGEKKQVYAMKVIRKSDMLRTSQEGHLRAERDFLIASEGSRWIVPLIASFEDATNLYLVMDYMPGGDFLGLLIRENTLHESVARFYVAEMIVCVEAAHALKCIHRDIKPDNFLISASGHLKISDFGLAFDGHWSHDTAYFNSHRYSLLNKLGINVDGDEQDKTESRSLQATIKWTSGIMTGIEKHDKKDLGDGEPLLQWRNRCGNRTSAMSVIGTSQYMAPEVIEGKKHKETFGFPARPPVSHRCQHLIASLIQDKENRLCSKRYHFKDLISSSPSGKLATSSSTNSLNSHAHAHPHDRSTGPKMLGGPHNFAGRYVFPYDAEDIKAHRWFRGIPWDRLHELEPPHVPQLCAVDDTHYFDEEDEISDWSESETSASEQKADQESTLNDSPGILSSDLQSAHLSEAPFLSKAPDATFPGLRPRKAEEARIALRGFRRSVQKWAVAAIAAPYDSTRLRNMDAQIDGLPGLTPAERSALRHFIRAFGRKDRKRPRDRLLRDRHTRGVVMEVRKKTAFLGYTWRRMRPLDLDEARLDGGMAVGDGTGDYGKDVQRGDEQDIWGGVRDGHGNGHPYGHGHPHGHGHGHEQLGDDIAVLRSLQRGKMSLR